MRVKDRAALVTGGAGVIGLAAAKRLLEHGARVALVDRDAAALERAAEGLDPARVHRLVADVAQPEQVRAYAAEAFDRLGPIDIFFNNAGIEGPTAPITEYPDEAFQMMMAINVTGVFLGMKYVLPRMRDGGSAIITSSIAGLMGSPSFCGYTTSKHAVIGLMRSAALDAAPRGIRVNTIHPGFVESEMIKRIERTIAGGSDTSAVRQSLLARTPLGRYITPGEIADTVLYLASDDSRAVTGGTFVIDGGVMI